MNICSWKLYIFQINKKYDQRNTCTCTIPFEMCNILRIAPGLALMSKQIGYSIPFIVTSK
jgi:hypothetical protein